MSNITVQMNQKADVGDVSIKIDTKHTSLNYSIPNGKVKAEAFVELLRNMARLVEVTIMRENNFPL